MRRSMPVVSTFLCFLCLFAANLRGEPPKPPPLTAAQKERLKERDRYGAEAQKLRQAGKLTEAIAAAEKMLAIEREVFGSVHEDVAGSLEQLAEMHEQREDFAAAKKARQAVLAIRTKLYGEKHWRVTDARLKLDDLNLLERLSREDRALLNQAEELNHRVHQLWRAGKSKEALPLAQKAVDIRRKTLGAEHRDYAQSLSNLGGQYKALAAYAAARPYHEQALAIRKKVLGPEHPATASSLNGLGFLLKLQGDYTAARPYYEQALAIFKKVLGPEHPDTAILLDNLGVLLQEQGEYAAARPYHEEALAIYKKILGLEHPNTAGSLNNLGLLLQHQGDYAAGRAYYEQALAIKNRVLGPEHPSTAASLNNLGTLCSGQGDYAAARPYYEQALAICKKVLGPEHPHTASSLDNLGRLLERQGNCAEARPHYEQALAIRNKVLGPEHRDTATSLNSLGVLLQADGNYAGAQPYCEQALLVWKKVLGPEHPDTSLGYRNLANVLHAEGQFWQAEKRATAAAEGFHAARLRISFGGLERTTYVTEHSPLPLLAALLARNGKPLLAWQRLEDNLARGLLDDLGARQRLAREERDRLTSLLGRLQKLDERIAELHRRADAAPLPGDTKDRERRGVSSPVEVQEARRKKLDELRKERDGLQLELTKFQAELEKKYGAAGGEVYDLARIQAQLPADAALVTWLDLKAPPKAADPNGEHWACVVRKSGEPVFVKLPGGGQDGQWTEEDDALPRKVYEQFHRPPEDLSTDWQELTKKLTAQRLAPLQEHLATVKHLIILHSDSMAGIPIEALTIRYSISYAPSGTMFAWLQERRPAKPQAADAGALLALGDPVFQRQETPSATEPTPPDHGVLVTVVQPGSNADQSGIKLGDVLLSYAETKLTKLADLDGAMKKTGGQKAEATRADDGFPVQLWRAGKTLKLSVRPGRLGVGFSNEPAATAIRSQREADQKLRQALRGESFVSLPGTRREVEAIAGLFADKGGNVEKLLGADASEPKLDQLAKSGRLQHFRYLHLATHGKPDRSGGLNSFLALSQDNLPDPLSPLAPPGRGAGGEGLDEFYTGRLTAERIARTWNLDTDLVTLSACETGLGEKAGGEGYKGFSQALFLAGARSLVLSMWKVDDQATALLMMRFYENLLGRHGQDGRATPALSKTAALSEAKRWLRNLTVEQSARLLEQLPGHVRGQPVEKSPAPESAHLYEHPYYWAGFWLIGDPGDVTNSMPVLAPPETITFTTVVEPAPNPVWPWVIGGGALLLLLGGLFMVRRLRHRPLGGL